MARKILLNEKQVTKHNVQFEPIFTSKKEILNICGKIYTKMQSWQFLGGIRVDLGVRKGLSNRVKFVKTLES